MPTPTSSRHPLRRLFAALLVVGLAAAGVFFVLRPSRSATSAPEQSRTTDSSSANANDPEPSSADDLAEPVVQTSQLEAYAMIDMNAGWLYFFRDEPNKYENGEVYYDESSYVQYFTGVETEEWSAAHRPEWSDRYYTGVTFMGSDERFPGEEFYYLPVSTSCWFNSSALRTVENLDLLRMDNVRDASRMFEGCNALGAPDAEGEGGTLDLSAWNMSRSEDLSAMFHNVGAAELNLRGWDTSRVRSMSATFMGCVRLEHIEGVEELDVSAVEDMSDLFRDAAALKQLDLSAWDTRELSRKSSAADRMFYNSGLEQLTLGANSEFLARGHDEVGTCIPDAAYPPEVLGAEA